MKSFIYKKVEKKASYGYKVEITVYRIKNNIPIRIEGEVVYNTGAYRGEDQEVVAHLIKMKELPKTAFAGVHYSHGYINYEYQQANYTLTRI